MKLEEAQQILHDNGFLMENITEDILSDILWDNLNTDTNTSMQGIRKVCDFLEYDLGKPIERASVKRIAETIVKLYNLGYESERFHPNHQRKIELKDAMKAAALIKAKAQETMTENVFNEGWKDDRAEWEKVKAKKYNGEKYQKWSETFNLGCGFSAQMIAAHPERNPLYHQSAKILIKYQNHEVASCWLHEQDTLDDSNIKSLKREIIQYAAKEVRDDDELDKILRNLNKVLNKINKDWWVGANKRNARAEIVDKERKRREYEARSKFHDSWNKDMEDKVGEKVTYKNRNGYKHGQIVGVIEDKDNKEKYYKVKWNENGKIQKINVRDYNLEPSGVDWYPRW